MARIEAEKWSRWLGRVEVYPKYLRIPDAVRYCGLPREEVERLCATRDFESFCYKLNPAATRGVRLIVTASIDRFMDQLAREATPWVIVPGDPHEMEPMASAKARVLEQKEANATT